MSINNLSRSFFMLTLMLSLVWMAIPVSACSPMEGAFDYTLEEQIEDANLIFIGTVTSGQIRSMNNASDIIEIAGIDVEQYLKGRASANLQVEGFGTGADCNSIVRLDNRYIFFVDTLEDGRYYASYMAVGDATMQANDTNIEDIVAITGTTNQPQTLSVMQQWLTQLETTGLWMIVMGISIMLSAILASYWFTTRRRRKQKPKRS